MIYIYDDSVMGCSNCRAAVRRLTVQLPRSDYRLWHTRRYRGTTKADAELVYTDTPDIQTGYTAAGVPVRPIGPDNL